MTTLEKQAITKLRVKQNCFGEMGVIISLVSASDTHLKERPRYWDRAGGNMKRTGCSWNSLHKLAKWSQTLEPRDSEWGNTESATRRQSPKRYRTSSLDTTHYKNIEEWPMKTKKIMWVGRSALMLEGKMKEKTVPGAVDLRGKASIRKKEKHLQQTYDEKKWYQGSEYY